MSVLSTGNIDDELPAYSEPRRRHPLSVIPREQTRTKHVYELKNSKGKAWASLRIESAARKERQLPTFFEGDPISGSVDLDLANEDSIKEVKVTIKGAIISNGHFSSGFTFFQESKTLWSRDMGDPREPDQLARMGKYSCKLSGSYSWPFSFTLPPQVTLCGFPHHRFHMPHTFLERGSHASVQYDIEAQIIRSRFRVDSKLQTMVAYVPAIRPLPPSPLRQLAYQEDSPLLSPDVDPGGWKRLEPFHVEGTVFNTRTANIRCCLYLATPLSYTRGSCIPCYITFSSNDTQALDLISNPRSLSVHLRRHICSGIGDQGGYVPVQGPSRRISDIGGGSAGPTDIVARATWWPSIEGAPEPNNAESSLHGEVPLPTTLVPTTVIGDFRIDYTLVVLPFTAPAFTPSTRLDKPIRECSVEIATLFPRGPLPRSYAPPLYSSESGTRNNCSIPPARVVTV